MSSKASLGMDGGGVTNDAASEQTANLLTTKRHFKALDGLRGVAALAVVTFHFLEMAIYDYSRLFLGHGFLAVDFFFCLSGFVIGYAYDDRVGTMGLWEFLKSRLIRLHPMVVFGAVLGLLALLFDPFGPHPPGQSASKVMLMFLASVMLIPYPAMQERAFNLFSLNAPAWSLFWEYVANLAYAAVVYRFNRRWLGICTAGAGVGLCVVGYGAGMLAGGWSGPTFWDGGVRVAYSFLAGLLVYRSGWIWQSRWIARVRPGFGTLAVLLMLAFAMPYAKGGWMREAAVILVYFPLIVALGAGARLTPQTQRLCTFAGNLSYPLYMTHYAVIWVWGNYYATYKPGAGRFALIVTAGVVVLAMFAWVVMVAYDTPVRRWLGERR